MFIFLNKLLMAQCFVLGVHLMTVIFLSFIAINALFLVINSLLILWQLYSIRKNYSDFRSELDIFRHKFLY